MPTSLTVDSALLRRMARDASIYSLTRPWAIVMWLALAAALVVSIVNSTTAGADASTLTAWMPVAVIALGAYAVWLSITSARRAVHAAMPPESTAWVELSDQFLRIGAGRRTSEIPYSEFQSVSARRDAVLLKLKGISAMTAVPRALLSDEDLAVLRAKISSPHS